MERFKKQPVCELAEVVKCDHDQCNGTVKVAQKGWMINIRNDVKEDKTNWCYVVKAVLSTCTWLRDTLCWEWESANVLFRFKMYPPWCMSTPSTCMRHRPVALMHAIRLGIIRFWPTSRLAKRLAITWLSLINRQKIIAGLIVINRQNTVITNKLPSHHMHSTSAQSTWK